MSKRILDVAVRAAILGLLVLPAIGFSQKARADHERALAELSRPVGYYLTHFAPRRPA